MMKQWSFKQKNLLLLAFVIIFWIIAYRLSIKNTIRLYLDNKEMTTQLAQTQNAQQRISQLQGRLIRMEEQYGLVRDSARTTHEFILGELSLLSDKYQVSLTNYPGMLKQSQNEFLIETNKIELTGDFLDIVEFLYQLEKLRVGRISSVSFEKKKDVQSRKEYLSAMIYLQNIKLGNETI